MKPFSSEKGAGKSDIALIEGDKIIQEDSEIANITKEMFGKAVASLNIDNKCILPYQIDTRKSLKRLVYLHMYFENMDR